MKFYKFTVPAILLCFVLLVWSCSNDSSDGTPENNDIFDRTLMLTNWADNIIVPAYQSFSGEVTTLKTATTTFINTPSETNLNALRAAWEAAYTSWQNVELFNIGPAETAFYRNFVNTYPTDVSSIEDNIASGSYNLQDINLNDAQGFPALDYLLYGLAESDTEVLDFYTTNPNANNYKMYLTDVTDRIENLTDQVVSSWESGYRDTFVNNNGASANSSTNSFVNNWMQYYEVVFRNGKIGFPAGVFSDGNTKPELVEALYNKNLSKVLCLEALNAFQNFFNGVSFNGDSNGESLASYLNALNTVRDGENLSALINNQFNTSRTAISGLNDNFFQQISTDNTAMLAAFETLQSNVVFLKSDMFSALSIQIEFESGDGD